MKCTERINFDVILHIIYFLNSRKKIMNNYCILQYAYTVVPPYSHPLYKHNLYIFTLVLGPVFYIVKCPLYCHKLIIVTITVIHGPNIIITYENFPIYSHISLLRKYIMSFESKILSFAVVLRSAPILIWE